MSGITGISTVSKDNMIVVFSFFDAKTLATANAVCKLWRGYAKDRAFLIVIYTRTLQLEKPIRPKQNETEEDLYKQFRNISIMKGIADLSLDRCIEYKDLNKQLGNTLHYDILERKHIESKISAVEEGVRKKIAAKVKQLTEEFNTQTIGPLKKDILFLPSFAKGFLDGVGMGFQ